MFEKLGSPPIDAIFSVLESCRADPRPEKIDLSAGVYKDESGNTPVMKAVKAAERVLLETQESKSYLGLAGDVVFAQSLAGAVLGDAYDPDRMCAVQAAGGCSAIRLLGEVVNRARPGCPVSVSEPSWPYHVPILRAAGLDLRRYPYFDAETRGIGFDAFMDYLAAAEAGQVVLLHGCCHNPTGADFSVPQWDALAEIVAARGLIPFVDLAYWGLGDGLEADAYGVRLLARRAPEMLIAISCSKNFSLYGERVATAVMIARDSRQRDAARGQFLAAGREMYSVPPDHGAAVVRLILGTPALRSSWERELEETRLRIADLRNRLANALESLSGSGKFEFLRRHKGMFSLLALDDAQMRALREKHAVYAVEAGRINIAGLSDRTVERCAAALIDIF